jgi:hypothetical protein
MPEGRSSHWKQQQDQTGHEDHQHYAVIGEVERAGTVAGGVESQQEAQNDEDMGNNCRDPGPGFTGQHGIGGSREDESRQALHYCRRYYLRLVEDGGAQRNAGAVYVESGGEQQCNGVEDQEHSNEEVDGRRRGGGMCLIHCEVPFNVFTVRYLPEVA